MLIRVSEATQLAYMPDYLWYYRKHVNSISNRGTKTRWLTGFKILAEARKRYPYRSSTIRKRLAVLNFRLGQVYRNEKSALRASVCFMKAVFYDPLRAIKVFVGRERTY